MAVTDEAIEKLREMIVSGRLKPGDRLPREADLATSLGLSRSSLREAVRALSLVRILDVRQGDGTYVSSLAADSLLDALSFIVEFHHDASVLELLEVRRILEPAASARAAVLIDDTSLASLEEILDRSTPDSAVEELVRNDVEFHRAIAVARGITQEGALARTLAEHRSIFGAIRAHDPELARTWATVHIAGVEDWIRTTLEQ